MWNCAQCIFYPNSSMATILDKDVEIVGYERMKGNV